MKKLDWYILKTFLVTFFYCILLFTAIAIAVDSSEKTDGFVSSGLSTMQLIEQYYIGFVPYIWGLAFPVFVFIAVIFFTSRMAMRSEFIAMLSAGVSFNRLLRPYVAGGLLLAILLWLGYASVIPWGNRIRASFQEIHFPSPSYISEGDYTRCFNCYYLRTDSNSFAALKDYNAGSQIAYGFSLQKIKDDKVIYNLRGNILRYDSAQKRWQVLNATERFVDSLGETIYKHDSLFIDLNIKPEELKKDEFLKDKLTTAGLKEYIKKEELRGTEGLKVLKVEFYRRSATPFSVFLLTMIGAIIAIRRTRGGSGLHLATGIAIAAVFLLSDRFSTVFAIKGNFHPFLAAWLPNVVFCFVAWWLYRISPK
jgi:lipopolysaccharide export system permease protein